MLLVAFVLFSAAVVLGAFLLARRLWRRAPEMHGATALAGLAVLALAIGRGELAGSFAWATLGLALAAAAGGATIFTLAWTRRARPALLVFLHAMAGGLAYLLVAGFVLKR